MLLSKAALMLGTSLMVWCGVAVLQNWKDKMYRAEIAESLFEFLATNKESLSDCSQKENFGWDIIDLFEQVSDIINVDANSEWIRRASNSLLIEKSLRQLEGGLMEASNKYGLGLLDTSLLISRLSKPLNRLLNAYRPPNVFSKVFVTIKRVFSKLSFYDLLCLKPPKTCSEWFLLGEHVESYDWINTMLELSTPALASLGTGRQLSIADPRSFQSGFQHLMSHGLANIRRSSWRTILQSTYYILQEDTADQYIPSIILLPRHKGDGNSDPTQEECEAARVLLIRIDEIGKNLPQTMVVSFGPYPMTLKHLNGWLSSFMASDNIFNAYFYSKCAGNNFQFIPVNMLWEYDEERIRDYLRHKGILGSSGRTFYVENSRNWWSLYAITVDFNQHTVLVEIYIPCSDQVGTTANLVTTAVETVLRTLRRLLTDGEDLIFWKGVKMDLSKVPGALTAYPSHTSGIVFSIIENILDGSENLVSWRIGTLKAAEHLYSNILTESLRRQ